MANDYLVSKWKLWYSSFDVNKDGKVNFEDAETERSTFSELHHLDGEEKKLVMDKFGKWWSEYILCGNTEITEPEFIEVMNNAFRADKHKFMERMQTCMETISNIVDINNDGDISEEEFNIIMKAAGHSNMPLDKKFFENFNPVERKVPIKVISDAWVHFVTSEDSSKPDLIKAALEFGV